MSRAEIFDPVVWILSMVSRMVRVGSSSSAWFWLKNEGRVLGPSSWWPEVGASSPVMSRQKVDFPAPLGPTIAILSPRVASKLKFSMTLSAPYCWEAFSILATRWVEGGGSGKRKDMVASSASISIRSILASCLMRD